MRFKLPTAFLLLPLIQVAMIAQPSGVAIRILMGTSDTVSAKWDGSEKCAVPTYRRSNPGGSTKVIR